MKAKKYGDAIIFVRLRLLFAIKTTLFLITALTKHAAFSLAHCLKIIIRKIALSNDKISKSVES